METNNIENMYSEEHNIQLESSNDPTKSLQDQLDTLKANLQRIHEDYHRIFKKQNQELAMLKSKVNRIEASVRKQ